MLTTAIKRKLHGDNDILNEERLATLSPTVGPQTPIVDHRYLPWESPHTKIILTEKTNGFLLTFLNPVSQNPDINSAKLLETHYISSRGDQPS